MGNVAQKTVLDYLDLFSAVGLRCLIRGMVLLPLIRLDGQGPLATGYWPSAVRVAAILALALQVQQAAYLSTSVTNAGFLVNTPTVMTPILAWIVLRERAGLQVWGAAGATLVGEFMLYGGPQSFGQGDASRGHACPLCDGHNCAPRFKDDVVNRRGSATVKTCKASQQDRLIMAFAAFSWHPQVQASPTSGGVALNFDYIIVGAGSAGCELANRFSADPSCRVLLIEAGGEPDTKLATIPGTAMYLWGSKLDWGYTTTPQKQLFGRCISYPRGRAVGGTSVLNLMMYVRGNRGDYDRWEAMGNPGWGYDDVLPYFRRSEGNMAFADNYYGTDGPMGVETSPHRHPLCERFLQAAQSIGIPYNPDFNGAAQEGCGRHTPIGANAS